MNVSRLAIEIVASENGAITAIRKIGDEAETTGRRGRKGFEEAGSGADKFNASAGMLNGTLSKVGGILGGFQLAQWAKDTLLLADTYTLLDARIGLVTDSTQELYDVENRLFAQAQAARVNYAKDVEIYTRLARSTENLNYSQNRLLNLTDLINKSMVVSGATAQEAGAAMIQFSQGLASETLRGDELRSVMEQTPRLAKAIADGLGITIGALRKLGEDGALTADTVLKAIEKSGEGIRSEFDQMPVTVGQAVTEIGNSFGALIDRINETSGTTEWLAGRLENVARWLDIISGKSREVTVEGLAKGVKGQIADIEKDMTRLSGWLDSPTLSSVGREGVEEQIQDLAKELVELNEELAYLRKPDDGNDGTDQTIARKAKSSKELTATWKEYREAMASTLAGEVAEIDQVTRAYDERREAVEQQYKGQATSQKELNDLAALDAAEQRDIAEIRAKAAEKRQKDDEKAKKAADDYAKSVQGLMEKYLPLEAEGKKYAEDLAGIIALHEKGILVGDRYALALDNLEKSTPRYKSEEKFFKEEQDRALADVEYTQNLRKEADEKTSQAITQWVENHKTATSQVDQLWEHSYERMIDLSADWLASGKFDLDRFGDYFGQMVSQMVVTWGAGQMKMGNSQALASMGGQLGVYGSMATGANPLLGLSSIGLSSINELLNPGSYMTALGSLQSGTGTMMRSLGLNPASSAMLESNFGAAAPGWIESMSATTFGSLTAGTSTFIVDLLSGKEFVQSVSEGLGAGTGFWAGMAISGGNPIVGMAVSALASMGIGSLFGGDDPPNYSLQGVGGYSDSSWSRVNGLEATKHPTADSMSWLYNPFVDTANQVSAEFNRQVETLKGQMSATAWDAFATALESTNLRLYSGNGEFAAPDTESVITSLIEGYGTQLSTALNTAVKAALPVLARELTENNATYKNMSAAAQAAIQAAINAPSFTAESLTSLTNFFDGVEAAITQARQPITDILDGLGKNDLEKGIYGLQKWYDDQVAVANNAKAGGLLNADAYTSWMDDINTAAGAQAQDLIDRYITPVTDSWRQFFDDITMSDLAPSQSVEGYVNKYYSLLNAAKSGDPADNSAFQKWLTSEGLPFAKALNGGGGGGNYNTVYDQVMSDVRSLPVHLAEIDTTNIGASFAAAVGPTFAPLVQVLQTIASKPTTVTVQLNNRELASAMINAIATDPNLQKEIARARSN